MCRIVEERAKEYAKEHQIEYIKSFLQLGKLTNEEIANSLKVPVEFVEDIANGKVA